MRNFKKVYNENLANTNFSILREDYGSIRELLFPDELNFQSISIKIGNVLERSYNDLLTTNNIKRIDGLKKIKGKNKNHQIDLLFEVDDVVYYYEMKSNISLDTEKVKETLEKLKEVKQFLVKKFKGKEIVSKVLSLRYYKIDENFKFRKGFGHDNVDGYGKFFNLIGEDTTEKEYKEILKFNREQIKYD